MRIRTVACTIVAAVAVASAFAPLPADARLATDEWKSVDSKWPGRQAVTVTDVVSFGKVAYASATTTKGPKNTPWVQRCSAKSCTATRLPSPGGNSTSVTSISGSSADDIWAVGTTIVSGGLNHPVFWHHGTGGWDIVTTDIAGPNDDIGLTAVEVSNASKAFAIGRFDYDNGVTTTLYRWNGTGWKEISPVLDDTGVFPAPCDGWFNRGWSDVITRPGSALLIGTCGSRDKPYVLEQGDTDWKVVTDAKLPTKVQWTEGAFVGQQVWLVGQRKGHRFIVARDGGKWSRISIEGIRPSAKVLDLSGLFASKVTAVGYVPAGAGHRIARAWRWGAGSWHETEVPSSVSKSRLSAVSVDGDGPIFAVGVDAARKPWLRALILRSLG